MPDGGKISSIVMTEDRNNGTGSVWCFFGLIIAKAVAS